jgi:hypothetical protein
MPRPGTSLVQPFPREELVFVRAAFRTTLSPLKHSVAKDGAPLTEHAADFHTSTAANEYFK